MTPQSLRECPAAPGPQVRQGASHSFLRLKAAAMVLVSPGGTRRGGRATSAGPRMAIPLRNPPGLPASINAAFEPVCPLDNEGRLFIVTRRRPPTASEGLLPASAQLPGEHGDGDMMGKASVEAREAARAVAAREAAAEQARSEE